MVTELGSIAGCQNRTNIKICIGGVDIEIRDGLLSTLNGLLSKPVRPSRGIQHAAWFDICRGGLGPVAPLLTTPRVVTKSTAMRGVILAESVTMTSIIQPGT